MPPSTIGGINRLPEIEKREIYSRYIPNGLIQKFKLPDIVHNADLMKFRYAPGSSDVEMMLYHKAGFPDPVLYGHLTDTMNGQIHILLYILNDPASPRFDVDKMPDGTRTRFGISKRNIDAETAAMQAGLAPGQVRKGLHLFKEAMASFEKFVLSLGHTMYFAEPLY